MIDCHNQRICHLSSVHHAADVRIFIKECNSLLKAGYDVTFVVQHDGDENIEGVNIKGIDRPLNRADRMIKTTREVYKRALECSAEIYHFHDPELIPVGFCLKQKGKKVIYDVHEDVPRQILSKRWIPAPLRKIIGVIAGRIENHAGRRFDCIVTATPYIRDRFISVNTRTVAINNYPILSELYMPDTDWGSKEKLVCYIGAISRARGIQEMVDAIGMTEHSLLLAGKFPLSSIRDVAVKKDGWRNVVELGQINRDEVKKVLSRSMAGLVLLHPEPNYINSHPIKMFEYMSAGIPVIASDFPLWNEIVEGNRCGLCVNPLNAGEIAKAINWIMDNPEQAQIMGENGRRAVENRFNWEKEERKLLKIYHGLLCLETGGSTL